MKLKSTTQSTQEPANKPQVLSPVLVTLDSPVYYYGNNILEISKSGIYCSAIFASTILLNIDSVCTKYGVGIAHLGIYNPRQARGKNGVPLVPERWSNHAFGNAIDFKGVVFENSLISVKDLPKSKFPNLLSEIIDTCKDGIILIKRKPEIVNETEWYHIGLYQKNK